MTDKKHKPKKPIFRAEPKNNKYSWQVQFTIKKPKFLIESHGTDYENCGAIQKLIFKTNLVLLNAAKAVTGKLENVAKRAEKANDQAKERAATATVSEDKATS
ncbi:TPA: hypothetical protein I7730_01070 [Vibrio vulnificus]|uniref:Uncharacterized protein n=1 Tax=Vibrio vulnificus TaxID=672 RepID=A0A8H9K5F8_VIBVL|nr:hypothetical protein [Vibrio vulnificus]HAS8538390.1 hypothetical protein [Vibrio vulnificus]